MPGSSGSRAQRAASGMGMANVEEQPACWASGPGTSGLLGDPDRLLHTVATSQFPKILLGMKGKLVSVGGETGFDDQLQSWVQY